VGVKMKGENGSTPKGVGVLAFPYGRGGGVGLQCSANASQRVTSISRRQSTSKLRILLQLNSLYIGK
jgi:hypothetical protein